MRVQVHLRAENLDNVARGRWRGKKSNPYATVSVVAGGSRPELSHQLSAVGTIELGKTEVVRQNLNPNWIKIFVLDHDEDRAWTPLKISVRDSWSSADKKNLNQPQRADSVRLVPQGVQSRNLSMASLFRSSDPTMGEVDVEVGEVLSAEGQEMKLQLEEGGCLYVHITESVDKQLLARGAEPVEGEFHCHIRGLDLENIEKGLLGLGAIDPYFELSKKFVDPRSGITRWRPIYRSEHIPDIINPFWLPFSVDLEKLCHGNLSRGLKISVWDYERGGKPDRWLGECETSVERLLESVTTRGNASRDDALSLIGDEFHEIGLVVVLKAEIL